MTIRSQRAVRGTAAAMIATFLAAVSHTMGGGVGPAGELIVAMGLLAAPLATVLVGKTLSLWRLTIVVGISQFAFHATFSVVGGLSPSSTTSAAGHMHETMTLAVEGTAATPVFLVDPAMGLAHVLAAVASVVVLYRAEWALRALSELVVDFVGTRTRTPAVVGDLLTLQRPASFCDCVLALFTIGPIRRRGPPLSL